MVGTRMRALVGLGALVALAVVPLPRGDAAAACVPGLQFEGDPSRRVVEPGETVTLSGSGYVEGCNDGGDADVGCGAPMTERPSEDVELRILQGTDEAVLATADARNEGDDRGLISWTVTIPSDAIEGRATLLADGSELDIRVRRP